MNDPREITANDPYNVLSSDEDENLEIARQLADLEAQKNDLINRLKTKKQNLKPLDPNFNEIQVKGSPEKPKAQSTQDLQPVPMMSLLDTINPNEQKLMNNINLNPNPPSYFIQSFAKAKRNETKQVKEHELKMNARVHSFAGADLSKQYKPILVDDVEEYSQLNISKRYIPKDELNRCLHNIKLLRLSKLFAKIRPPKFSEPDYANWATIGIISAKENVKLTSSNKPTKFFKFTITNFQYTLDIFIFGKAGVQKYYNLRVGDIIAILNPEVLPWRPEFKGNSIKSFNLRISHKFDCILEIGASKDIGWCQEINRTKGTKCGSPINKSKQDRCDYHRELQFRSTNAKRVELSGSYALGAPTQIDSRPALYRGSSDANVKQNSNFKVIADSRYIKKKINDPLSSKRHHFSTSNSAKAFFDEDFQNPDILVNLESKRRKLGDTKRDMKLEKALQESTCDSLFISKNKTAEEIQSMRDTTDATLQSGFIQKLGFDPTGGKIRTLLEKSTEKKIQNKIQKEKRNAMEDLMTFKKSSVNLKPSREELLKKKQHREKSFAEYKRSLAKRKDTIPDPHLEYQNDDSDDLEII